MHVACSGLCFLADKKKSNEAKFSKYHSFFYKDRTSLSSASSSPSFFSPVSYLLLPLLPYHLHPLFPFSLSLHFYTLFLSSHANFHWNQSAVKFWESSLSSFFEVFVQISAASQYIIENGFLPLLSELKLTNVNDRIFLMNPRMFFFALYSLFVFLICFLPLLTRSFSIF